jgi:phosphocarrier protein
LNHVEQEFTVNHELGLHARPAGRFVTLAGTFSCEVSVERSGEWVSGVSVLSLLSLAAGKGVRLRVRAEGPDADEAVSQLGRLLEEPDED